MALTQEQLRAALAARVGGQPTRTLNPLNPASLAGRQGSRPITPLTPDLAALAGRGIGAHDSSNTGQPPVSNTYAFNHPGYTGTDPAYAAWLAQADLSSADAASAAKLRKAQAQTAYDQAMQDILNQGTEGRRNIQTSMLQRGMFGSGETQRRGQEFDSAVNVSKQRALSAETDQFGQADEQYRSAINSLGMQATQQVSQAMLRDSMTAYQAQQAALAAQSVPVPTFAPNPVPQQQAPQQQANPNFNPTMPAVPDYNPVYSSAGLQQSQSLPKPKSGVQPLKLVRKGLQ